MSTKATLRNGPRHHLYREVFDDQAVYLDLENCEFEAARNHVTVRIPLAIWEHIRIATIANFDLAEMSDEDLEAYVRGEWQQGQQQIAESTQPVFAKAIGRRIWSGKTPEEELEHGLRWYSAARDKQRAVRDELAKLGINS